MKNLLIIILAVGLSTTFISAQTKLGLKLGLNFSNLYGSDVGETSSLLGISGGAYLSYMLSDVLEIQPEVYFSRKGAKEKGVTETETFDYDFALDYIEVPLLLKVSFPIEKLLIRPTIFAGPAISFKTNAKISRVINGYVYDVSYDYIKSTEVSLILGAGMSVPSKHYDWGFDLRYILGLTKIDDSGDNLNAKNNVINFNFYFGTSLF